MDDLITAKQLQIVSKNKQKQIDALKNTKVDKEEGKGLSSNDFSDSYKAQVEANTASRHTHSNKSVLDATTASYTTAEKTKLSGIASGAEVNVQSDWEESDNSKDDFIKNKPEFERVDDRLIPILPYIDPDKEYNFIDHINEPTYRFTAPANSKLLMLQSITGNSNKIAPSTPSDDSVARLKFIPENTYKSQFDYVGGKTCKYNQFAREINSTNWSVASSDYGSVSFNDNEIIYTNTVVATGYVVGVRTNNYISASDFPNGHKGIIICEAKASEVNNDTRIGFDILNMSGSFSNNLTTTYQQFAEFFVSNSSNQIYICYRNNPVLNSNLYIRDVVVIDLTSIFGAGNEPSTVETAIPLLKANSYKLDGTDTYSTGSLKHAIVSEVKYEAVNLLNIADKASTTTNGITYKIENDLVSINGTVNSGAYPQLYGNDGLMVYLEAGTYTISKTQSHGGLYMWLGYGSGHNNIVNTYFSNFTFTISESGYYKFNLVATSSSQFANYTTRVVINRGSTALPYIPYVAPITKAIPSEVLADTRYGLGFDNTNYNKLDCNTGHLSGNRNRVKLKNMTWYRYEHSALGIYFFADITSLGMKYEGTYGSIIYSLLISNYKVVFRSPDVFLDKTICVDGSINTPLQIQVKDGSYDDATAFKNHFTDDDYLEYELAQAFDQDYSQYFTPNWNKVDLDNKYATCEMVVNDPIDMPNKVEYYGTIIHSLATAVKYESFNVLDEEFELGGINTNGQPESASNRIRSKNYFAIIGGLQYYLNGNNKEVHKYFYDENYNFISGVFITANGLFTPPSNAAYMKIVIWLDTTYHNDICINISNQDLNGTYKPHKTPITRLLPNSEEKYSWGIADGVRNIRVFCDDECNPVNEGQVNVGTYTFNGNESWYFNNEANREIITTSSTNLGMVGTTNGISDDNLGLQFVNNNYSSDGIYIATANVLTIFFRKYGIITDTNTAKQYLVDRTVEYEKATTDTETLDDFDFSFDCEEGDTFTIIGCELLQCYATYSFVVEHVE